MPCRVGITTKPEERKNYWQNNVVGFKNWKILARYHSREKAQAHEDRYAKTYGCRAHAGGADAHGIWHVYRFDYIRAK